MAPKRTNADRALKLGWIGIEGVFQRLQQSVRILADGKGLLRDRLDQATLILVSLREIDFPKQLRQRARSVLTCRGEVRVVYANGPHFEFSRLGPKRRKQLIADIIRLYEACLIDLGRLGRTSLVPRK